VNEFVGEIVAVVAIVAAAIVVSVLKKQKSFLKKSTSMPLRFVIVSTSYVSACIHVHYSLRLPPFFK